MRILVGINFNELAAIIETSFEWSVYHLYEIEIEVEGHLENPIYIKPQSSVYPQDCEGTSGYEEYYPNDEGREKLDIKFIKDELESYKNFAKD